MPIYGGASTISYFKIRIKWRKFPFSELHSKDRECKICIESSWNMEVWMSISMAFSHIVSAWLQMHDVIPARCQVHDVSISASMICITQLLSLLCFREFYFWMFCSFFMITLNCLMSNSLSLVGGSAVKKSLLLIVSVCFYFWIFCSWNLNEEYLNSEPLLPTSKNAKL